VWSAAQDCFALLFWLTSYSSLKSPDFRAVLLLMVQIEQQKVRSLSLCAELSIEYFQLSVETSEQWLVAQLILLGEAASVD